MKRWAIARMGDYDGDGSITPAFNKYPCNSRIWTKGGFNWCIGQIAAADLTTINADPDIYVLPDGAMDMALSAIPANIRTTMKNRCEAAGFSFVGVQNSWTVRQLLNFLAQQLQSWANVEAGDVIDIEQ